jgi:hypothetical protein
MSGKILSAKLSGTSRAGKDVDTTLLTGSIDPRSGDGCGTTLERTVFGSVRLSGSLASGPKAGHSSTSCFWQTPDTG